MKKINLLIIIIFTLHAFTNVGAEEDKTPPNPNDSDECYTALTNKAFNEIVEQALKNGIEETAEKLNIPFKVLSDWVDDKFGSILTNILEETTENYTSLLNASYWVLKYRLNPLTEIELKKASIGLQPAIDATAEQLNISLQPLLIWLTNRNIQLSVMHTIAQRTKEGTMSDWAHEYKAEIDKLQFPPQYAISLLHGDGRHHVVQLAAENGIEKTAKELDIPHSILSLLAFRYDRHVFIRRITQSTPLDFKKDIVAEAMKMRDAGMNIGDIARDLGISLPTLALWLHPFPFSSVRAISFPTDPTDPTETSDLY